MERIKSKINEKLKLLFEAFTEHPYLSIADIMRILDCNRQSAYNYLSRFEAAGFTLDKNTGQKLIYYSLADTIARQATDITYIPITGKMLFKYEILNHLQQGSATAKELKGIGISTSYLYKLLSELLRDKDIIKSDSTYHLNTAKHPTVLSFSESDIVRTGATLSNVATSNPYYPQLNSIAAKINLTLGNIGQNSGAFDNYIIYGHKYFHFENISRKLEYLNSFDYTGQLLQIEYTTRSQATASVLFATGMIVYALEKDRWYLMGKCYDNNPDDTENMIIKYDSITHISETTRHNTHFNSEEFKDIYKTMFSISIEQPFRVVVEFDDIFNIRRKLEQLCAQRSATGKLHYQAVHSHTNRTPDKTGKIIYTDTIRGLSDFAAYLRRFGRAATVIEPQELKDMMELSVHRTLERYLQEAPFNE